MSKPLVAVEIASIKREMARLSNEINYNIKMDNGFVDKYTRILMEKHAKLHDKLYAEEV